MKTSTSFTYEIKLPISFGGKNIPYSSSGLFVTIGCTDDNGVSLETEKEISNKAKELLNQAMLESNLLFMEYYNEMESKIRKQLSEEYTAKFEERVSNVNKQLIESGQSVQIKLK